MLGLRKRARAGIPTPAAGGVTLAVDSDGLLVLKKEDGSVVAPESLVGELGTTVAGLAGTVATKQDAASAATDTELAGERIAREGADATLTTAAAAAKAVADAALPKAGGILTGALTLAGDPTANLHPATKQWTVAQIAALINGAPGALDTLKEIADKLGADETVAEALAAVVAGKLGAANNLGDLVSTAAARGNLGLGTAATKAAGEFDAAGAAAAIPGAIEEKQGFLNACNHGVLPGLGDVTTALSAFYDLCHEQGKVAYLPGGTATFESGAIVKSYGLNVAMDPNTTIKAKAGVTTALWTFEGSLAAAQNLEAEAAEGSNELTVPATAGMAAGTVLLLGTETLIPEGQAARYRGQLVEIAEVLSGTKVKLRERLYRTFTSHAGADKSTVQLVNAITGSVTGGKFTNPTAANTRFVVFKHARDVSIDTETDGQLQPGIEVQNVYGFRIRSRSEHGVHDNTTKFGYAVFAGASSCHGRVVTDAANGNYAFQSSGVNNLPGEPYDILVTGTATNSSRCGFGVHPEGHHIVFADVTASNCVEAGVGVAGPHTAVIGGEISRCQKGVEMITGANKGCSVSDVTFSAISDIAVDWHLLTTMEDHVCTDNIFEGCGGVAIRSTGKMVRYRQGGNKYTGYGTKAEGGNNYCWRHEKQLENSSITVETIDATGGNNVVAYFDEEQTSGLDLALIVIRGAPNAALWLRNGSGGPKTIARWCIVNGTPTSTSMAEVTGLEEAVASAITTAETVALAAAEAKVKAEKERAEAVEAVALKSHSLWARAGSKAETFSRLGVRLSEAVANLTSGRLMLYAIELPPEKISSITFTSLVGLTGGENQWFCLVDTALNVLGKTADDGATAWSANAEKTLALSAPYTPGARMAAYVGIMVKAATPPTLVGYAANANASFRAPAVVALSTASLTNPASLGATAAALAEASAGGVAYAYVS